ncbi:helicase [Paraburkholderia hospita]|uniref:Helicase n=1 Tax=Paraburkholderia hospita TaxID=169430 RepID=A0ABN0FNT8_9BURK|nr:helicase-related protein [Paraburkholderia hospita]EIN00413.1 helicase [Paraburkholderia hospita]OUL88424.1 helicase [Paraburkholderia hospita]
MNELLKAFAATLCQWLETKLPSLGANWWNDHVVDRLTFQQQRMVQERPVESLGELDLAALLRIFDQNWHELAANAALPKNARNWLKELQTVRNRWAHAPSGGLSAADAYRDADTLARLLDVIGASPRLQEEVSVFKGTALSGLSSTNGQADAQRLQEPAAPFSPAAPAHRFAVGQLVCLKSNPNAVFPVIEVLATGAAETRIRVFENGGKQVYYQSQLRVVEEDAEAQQKVLSTTDLSALLTALYLSSPSASALYSFNSGRISFVPYQYRPVFKLIHSDRPRLLVADEVGVGKTVEAGLVLKELQARNDIKSVLVICPKALVAERKWELEMKRFDEHFTTLDGSLLRHCIRETHLSGEWPVQHEKTILPFSLFDNDLLFGKPGRGKARDMGLLELDPPPKFDLVIVDEAHHIRNSETYLHQAVRYFCDNAEAVVFLSATPVQLGREDLFTLLNVLRPDVIIDPASFAQMAEPNRFINEGIQACRRGEADWGDQVRAALRSVADTAWGRNVLSVNPGFQHIYDALAESTTDGSGRIRTIQSLEDLYTFSSLINRTRRRDIGEFTTRKPETVVTDFTPSQRALHDDLLGVIARILARLHGNQNVKFMMSTISRQAASSLYGLAPMLESMMAQRLDVLEALEANDVDDDGNGITSYSFLEQIRGDIEALVERAKRLDNTDLKADAFLKVVRDKVQMPKNKVLVFSTFRHTLAYLVRRLQGQDIRFGLVHGDIADEDRAILRRRFGLPKEDEDALDVLLSSEVGCEGLDFQFCDCLVNYDLPWNPMRIEQRIGRIDRYGQQSETVAIFNFITPGTIDADIYNRCLARIGVFHHAIGASEEILGEITRELHSISETFSMTEEERGQRLQQLADNKIRQIEEEQKLEERQGELFGLNVASASWEEKLRRSRNYWLEPAAVASALSTYLGRRLGRQHEVLLGDKPLKVLRLSQEARASLLEDFRKLPRSNEPVYRAWERWLKGTAPTLSVTFDQTCALENPSAALLSLSHPLARQAAQYLLEPESVAVQLRSVDDTLPSGAYPFAVYRWTRQGVRRDEELMAVADEPSICAALFELLQRAGSAPELEMPGQETFDALDAIHHRQWMAAAAGHAEDNRQLVGVRIESLTASHRARRSLLEDQIARATNEKISIMKRAELERAQADFDSRIAALTVAADGGDIRATPVVFGIIDVRRPA